MKKILILGAGTAGTMMANKLRKTLRKEEWVITLVDNDKIHYYQPGFLFIPFGKYTKKNVIKPKTNFLPKHTEILWGEIDKVIPEEKSVLLTHGKLLTYDYLLIASGAILSPEETIGLTGNLWKKDIFEFYTAEGAIALHEKFKNWQGGKLVMAIVDIPFKCPIAPIEFVCLADSYFTKRGIREKVEITLCTPLGGAFTKPIATKVLGDLLEKKNIKVVTDFYIERVDNENKKLISYDEKEVSFDLLTIVPLNKGANFVGRSGLGDDLNFIPVDRHTMQHAKFANIFVLGDAAAIPTSKAGSVAHFSGDFLYTNMIDIFKGKTPSAKFDGHANCYIETGFGKATLIDFNYETEPLPGTYPIPSIGPFSLLKTTRINHWGKLLFKWIYWNILIMGRHLPVTAHMSMAGKKLIIDN